MKFFELLFGKAAVVGFKSIFGRPIEYEIEIDPVTGREALWSMMARRQRELRGP